MKRLLFFLLGGPLSITAIFGQNTAPKSVFFDTDKAVLRPQSQTILREMADSARKMAQYTLYLQGHTDADGSDAHNQSLSERRTDAVRKYLINQGIAAEKITISALGKSKPVAENNSDDSKQRNRRVDISFDFANASMANKAVGNKPSPFEKGKNCHIMRLYKELSLTPQTFTIKSNKDTIIKGESGTQLHFPSGAFAGIADGTPVEIKLKECYDYASILAEHLTTKSGDKLLQTGGMIYVQATANGKELTLQRPMDIQFSSAESKLKGMQLFTGERKMENNGAMDWTPINPSLDDGFNPSEEAPKNPSVYINYIYIPELNKLETSAPMNYILDMTDTDSLYEEFPVYGKLANPKERFRARSTSFAGNAMGVYACQTPDIIGKDKFTIHRLAFSDVYKFFKVETFEELQKQDSSVWNQNWRMKASKLKEDKRINDSLEVVRERESRIIAAKNRVQYEKDYKTKIVFDDVFGTTTFGWTNCDRFVYYDPIHLTTINLGNAQSPSIEAKLILKRERIVIQNAGKVGEPMTFKDVFKNKYAVIVAMKIENGQSYLAMQDIITTELAVVELKFEALSPDEIKERLKKLN
jgi:OmpA family